MELTNRWDAKERLRQLGLLLEELTERPGDQVILVEGRRDVGGLNLLGVHGEMVQVQSRDGILHLAEQLAREGKKAIILTDWDRKGGQLSRLLKHYLACNEVPFDEEKRVRLARISKGEIKDVESLPSYFSRLVREAEVDGLRTAGDVDVSAVDLLTEEVRRQREGEGMVRVANSVELPKREKAVQAKERAAAQSAWRKRGGKASGPLNPEKKG